MKWRLAIGCLAALGFLYFTNPSHSIAEDEKKPAEPAKARDFSGKYLADGKGAGDKPYKAMVEISRDGEVYGAVWVISPREQYRGVGLVEGDSLCIGWSAGETPGLVIYKPEKEQLVGRWVAPGAKGQVFKETLTPVK